MPLSRESAHGPLERPVSRIALHVVVMGVLLAIAGCQAMQSNLADHDSGFFGRQSVSNDASQPSTAAEPSAKVTAARNEAAVIENLNLGHREVATNHPQQAEKYYHRVLALQPNNAIANHRLAVLADKRREYATAEYYYLAAMRLDPNNPDLLSDFGYSCYLQGRLQESERSLLAATRIAPSHEKATHNLGVLYAAMGDYDRSYEALKRALGEHRAQIEIAQLFPDYRPVSQASTEHQPNSSDAQAGSEEEPIVASFEAFPAGDDKSGAQVAESVSGTTPSQLAAPSPFGRSACQASALTSNRQIPDGKINEVFSDIDRSRATSPQSISAELKPPARTPIADTAFAGQGLEAASHANPLDAMPLWPAEAAGSTAGETVTIADSPDDSRPVGDGPAPSFAPSRSAHATSATTTPAETSLPFDEQELEPASRTSSRSTESSAAAQATPPLGMGAPEPLFPAGIPTELPPHANVSSGDAFDAIALKSPRIAATAVMVPSFEFDVAPQTFVVLDPPRNDRARRRKVAGQRMSQSWSNSTVARARIDTSPADATAKNSSVSQVSADRGFLAIPYEPPTVPSTVPLTIQPRVSPDGAVQSADSIAPANAPSTPDRTGGTGNRGPLGDETSEPDDGPIIRPGSSH